MSLKKVISEVELEDFKNIIIKTRGIDLVRNCYLSDFEILQTKYWLEKHVSRFDAPYIKMLTLALMNEDAVLYMNDLVSMIFEPRIFDMMVAAAMVEDNGPSIITLKYYTSKDLNHAIGLTLDMKPFWIGVEDENNFVINPARLESYAHSPLIRIRLVDWKDAVNASSIALKPVHEMLEYYKDSKSFMRNRREKLRSFAEKEYDSLISAVNNSSAIVEMPEDLIMICPSSMPKIVENIREDLEDEDFKTYSEKTKKNIILTKIEAQAKDPFICPGIGQPKIMLYRYVHKRE
ncbi:MAG: hypothetical protein JW791_00095 [Nanoarchaeota archaeon]|nr:hypothetical protein [Nanoarchaeota archaeon]